MGPRIAPFAGDLPVGDWRPLTPVETTALYRLVALTPP